MSNDDLFVWVSEHPSSAADEIERLRRELDETRADHFRAVARASDRLDAIERAGKCLAMSNNGAREALAILRAAKEDANG